MHTGQAPTDFHCRGERRNEADVKQAGEADKGAIVVPLQRPQAEAMTVEMRLNPGEQLLTFTVAQARGEVAHYLGIGIQRRKRRQVRVTPATQVQTWAVQFNRFSHHGSA
ncbi:hypothetical protein D9M68_902770 [compost metagenome]